MDFPTTLKMLLDNKDMTQADLSRSSGIPTSLISNYARGLKRPRLPIQFFWQKPWASL